MTDHYAVIGNPVKHSQSPVIHAAFARQTGQDIDYIRLLAPLDDFNSTVKNFFGQDGKGLNVTVPFKEQAWALADQRSPRAELAGAVNTLNMQDNGLLAGDNTDGVGLVRDIINNHGGQIHGKRLLVVGAGGAARGILGPLLDEQPAQLIIANRTEAKAVELANHFSDSQLVEARRLDALSGKQFDLIINGTSASLHNEVPALPDNIVATNGWCYDMMYTADATLFVRWGLEQGATKSVDGLGMLVEQAAESFYIWRGVRPDTSEIITTLRANM